MAILHYSTHYGPQKVNAIPKLVSRFGEVVMSRLRMFSSTRAGMMLLAMLAVISLLSSVGAKTTSSQRAAKPAQGNTQNSLAPEPIHRVTSPAEEKSLNDVMYEPREISAAIVAADNPAPKYVVMIGAHHGEYLEVFLDKFPNARALWTEPNNSEGNLPVAKARLARFGDRVDFKYGCGERDISDGCVPKGPDVIITDWVSILQNLDGMYKIYRIAAEQLAPGGWFVNIDQVSFGNSTWDSWIQTARKGFRPDHEWPPVHHPDFRTPTIEEQLGAMRAAGLDAQVVWQSFSTVVLMGRKK